MYAFLEFFYKIISCEKSVALGVFVKSSQLSITSKVLNRDLSFLSIYQYKNDPSYSQVHNLAIKLRKLDETGYYI